MVAKITTLEEIERHWSIDDLFDAHEALDLEIEFQNYETEKVNREIRRIRK